MNTRRGVSLQQRARAPSLRKLNSTPTHSLPHTTNNNNNNNNRFSIQRQRKKRSLIAPADWGVRRLGEWFRGPRSCSCPLRWKIDRGPRLLLGSIGLDFRSFIAARTRNPQNYAAMR